MCSNPFCHYGTAARDYSRQTLRRIRNMLLQQTGVDCEVIDTLFALFDKGILEDFPRKVFGFAVNLFQCLINRHTAHRNGTIADYPLPCLVYMLACR